MPSILSQMSWRSSVTSFSTVGVRLVALMSRIERKYFLMSTSYIHIWQGYSTSSYYSTFDRIVCVLWTFYQWGHFVMLIIRKFNLLAFNPGHIFLVDIWISLLKFYTRGFQDGKAFHCHQQGDYKRKTWNGIRKSTCFKSRRGGSRKTLPWLRPWKQRFRWKINDLMKKTWRNRRSYIPIERLICMLKWSLSLHCKRSFRQLLISLMMKAGWQWMFSLNRRSKQRNRWHKTALTFRNPRIIASKWHV